MIPTMTFTIKSASNTARNRKRRAMKAWAFTSLAPISTRRTMETVHLLVRRTPPEKSGITRQRPRRSSCRSTLPGTPRKLLRHPTAQIGSRATSKPVSSTCLPAAVGAACKTMRAARHLGASRTSRLPFAHYAITTPLSLVTKTASSASDIPAAVRRAPFSVPQATQRATTTISLQLVQPRKTPRETSFRTPSTEPCAGAPSHVS